MIRVLFVCEHNSARSQMADAYLRHFGGDKFQVDSAGIEPGQINPYVVESMKEDDIDISASDTNSVFNYFQEERQYDIVVTVCSPEVSDKCPVFPGKTLRFNWPFPDPSKLAGEREEILADLRVIRDQIKDKIKEFISEYEEKGYTLFLQEYQG